MQAILLILHVLLAISLIVLVLIQHGRGADAGAAFGSGASSTVFGARGAGSFLTKATTLLAIGFFANSIALAYLSSKAAPEDSSIFDNVQVEAPLEGELAADTAAAVTEAIENAADAVTDVAENAVDAAESAGVDAAAAELLESDSSKAN